VLDMNVRPLRTAALALALASLAAPPAHALKVVTWNLWQYPTSHLATRQPYMRTVMAGLDPDVVITQETFFAGADSFLNVLRAALPGRVWKSAYLASTESGIFWDSTLVNVTNISSYNPPSGPRDVLQAIVKPLGYVSKEAWCRIYSVHLKAGNTAADSTTRRLECTEIRNFLNGISIENGGANFMIGGDFNFYGAWEGGYLRLTESQADDDGRGKDPLLMPGGWHMNSGYGLWHTQCPCNLTGCLSGFSGGGMDDRFDLWLSSYSLQDGVGADLVLPSGYITYGNDGLHYNDNIDGGGFNNAVGLTIATALRMSSDHLPVAVILRLPARVVAASALDFDTVLVDTPAERLLEVANGALAPADPLTYSLAAPGGFTAPGGTFEAAAGAAPNAHAIGMDTATRGPRSGALVVSSDAPDSLTKNVLLSGLVLSHAIPSLDSLAALTLDTLDLGEHESGEFEDGAVRVHNRAWDALQARLSVSAADFSGGDGRFSIAGGFTPVHLAGTGTTWNVRFDDAGATGDSLYEATLTFTCADEAHPGATALPALTVALRARPLRTPGAVDEVLALRFEPARPNPFRGATRFAFTLPEPAPVTLDLFDLSGRRVAGLARGVFGAGRHDVAWGALDAAGARVPAGLYFARFWTPGLERTARIVLLP
jgi:endonuclease/exonuclease/phosphatase family metal-dependent hydrolase